MPAYHSEIVDVDPYKQLCSTAILPLKTQVRGNAPACPDADKDIVDEAIEFFRANVLFRSFTPKGPADLLLAYLTVYFGEILRFVSKFKTAAEAKKEITKISLNQQFPIPGEQHFPLPGFFAAPANRNDQESIRTYMLQLRQEAANRLLDHIYTPEGTQNKWWFMFQRKKFMNIDKTA